ncbi:hypothetical protein CA51_51570 [Rosistilla oblonga]|nr:hypothetical protein CA51_51570 [Rosistilla oblonga]
MDGAPLLSPEGGTRTAGAVRHRTSDRKPHQARRATQAFRSLCHPPGFFFSISPLAYR